MNSLVHTCKNCSHKFSGNYCNNCGEKIYQENDKNVRHFLGEVFHFSTHLDGKFFITLKTIFATPGKLSLDYCNGVRKKYFKPLSLFLFIVILYLFFPKYQGLNMRFSTYVSPEYNYAWFAKPVAKNKISNLGISYDELAARYDARSQKFAKPFLLLILPLSALVLFLLFYKRRKYFFDHFVLSIELSSFIFATVFLFIPFLNIIATALYPGSAVAFRDGGILYYFVFGLLLWVTIVAIRRFYVQGWFWSILKSLLFLSLFAFVIIDIIYNFLLYLTVNLFI